MVWNRKTGRFLLFHLADEGVWVNAQSSPDATRAYQRLSRVLIAWSEEESAVTEPEAPEEVPSEIRDALEALGYVEEEPGEAATPGHD